MRIGKRTANYLLISMLLLVFPGTANAAVQKGPYLIYDGLNTAMTVLWQLDSTQTCTIDWGEDTAYGTGSAGTVENGGGINEHQHFYTITGLTPALKYFYQVSCSTDVVGSGSFHAAPPDQADSVKLLAYGDTRSNPDDHDLVSAEMLHTLALDPGYQTITLHVGDWVNNGDAEADWAGQFFDPFWTNTHEFQATMPINGARGNHEGSGALFYKYFPYLYEPGGFYWSFDYGPVHVAVVDQYVAYSPGSVQHTWLENDLAASTKPWKFLVFHEPGWSAGGHGNDSNVQDYIQPLAVTHGVDVIFAGHNHYYARAVVDGVQHVTTGGGGAPLYAPNPAWEHVVATAQSLHFCEVDIQGSALYFTARDEVGIEIDSFQLNQLTSTNSYAHADIPVKGTVDGSYADTHELDGVTQTITERSSGGKPIRRFSQLEHKWAFQVPPGVAVTLFAEVFATASDDGDAFTFAWSSDDAAYHDMFTVDDASAPSQSYSLDPAASGTVYVRVVDTDRTAGTGGALDSILVDQIFIRSDQVQGDPPDTPANLNAVAISAAEISLAWDDVADEYGFTVQRWDGSGWMDIATPGANVLNFTDSGLSPETNYRYRVSAFNGAGSSPPSIEANATTHPGSLISLVATPYKTRGVRMVDLEWSGAGTTLVDIFRNGSLLATTGNDGWHTDTIGKRGGTYTYRVCEAGDNPDCSDTVTVTF